MNKIFPHNFYYVIFQDPAPLEVDADNAGAVGGADVRRGAAALMDAMRDLISSIRFMPPPVENPQNGDDEHHDDEAVDDDEWDEEWGWEIPSRRFHSPERLSISKLSVLSQWLFYLRLPLDCLGNQVGFNSQKYNIWLYK